MLLSDSYRVRLAQVKRDLELLNSTNQPGMAERRIITAACTDIASAIEKLEPITQRRTG